MTAYEAIMYARGKPHMEYRPWEAFLMLVCAGWPWSLAWVIANGGNPVGPPVLSTAPTEPDNLQTICKRA